VPEPVTMGNSSSSSEPKALRPHVLRTQNNGVPRSAAILGATGATGKFITSYLVLSSEWDRVTIVHRREVDLDAIAKQCGVTFDDAQKSKVTQHVVDMASMCADEQVIADNVEKFRGHDVLFCVLGTKRSIAGSAENFRKVDQYMVRDGAILSRKAGIAHFSLLTSKGASPGIWANDWKISHGLLYLKVKGDAEAAVLDLKFPRTSIFRPGFLARDGDTGGFVSKLDVRDLAAAMLYDAETADIESGGDAKEDVLEEAQEEHQEEPKEDAKEEPEAAAGAKGDAETESEAEPKGDAKKEPEEEPAESAKSPQSEQRAEQPVVYETEHIDDVVPLARNNYNLVCSPMGDQRGNDDQKEDGAADKGDGDAAGNANDEEPEDRPEPKTEGTPEQKAEDNPEPDAEDKPEEKPEEKPEQKTEDNPLPKADAAEEPQEEANAAVAGDADNFEVVDKPEDASNPTDNAPEEEFVEVERKDVD